MPKLQSNGQLSSQPIKQILQQPISQPHCFMYPQSFVSSNQPSQAYNQPYNQPNQYLSYQPYSTTKPSHVNQMSIKFQDVEDLMAPYAAVNENCVGEFLADFENAEDDDVEGYSILDAKDNDDNNDSIANAEDADDDGNDMKELEEKVPDEENKDDDVMRVILIDDVKDGNTDEQNFRKLLTAKYDGCSVNQHIENVREEVCSLECNKKWKPTFVDYKMGRPVPLERPQFGSGSKMFLYEIIFILFPTRHKVWVLSRDMTIRRFWRAKKTRLKNHSGRMIGSRAEFVGIIRRPTETAIKVDDM